MLIKVCEMYRLSIFKLVSWLELIKCIERKRGYLDDIRSIF